MFKRDSLKNSVTKILLTPATVITGTAGTATSSTLDLGLDMKYSGMKVIFPYVKSGTGTCAMTLTVQTDTVNTFNSATYAAAYAVSTPGTTSTTDAGHGAISTAVSGLAELFVDLMGAQRYIRILVSSAMATTDTVTGPILVVLEGAREEPMSNAGVQLTCA